MTAKEGLSGLHVNISSNIYIYIRYVVLLQYDDPSSATPRLSTPEKGGLVWWERLVTLDLAKTLELGTADRAGGGLRGGLCRSLAEENANWIDSDDARLSQTRIGVRYSMA